MFTSTPVHEPKVTVPAKWYTHPVQLKCFCGVTLYAKRQRSADFIRTMFICEAGKCDQVILFEDKLNG